MVTAVLATRYHSDGCLGYRKFDLYFFKKKFQFLKNILVSMVTVVLATRYHSDGCIGYRIFDLYHSICFKIATIFRLTC